MNKLAANRFLEYLLVLPYPIPLSRDLAGIATGVNRETGPLKRKLERFYTRLCRLQNELNHLDLKKARAGAALGVAGYKTLEDFVYSQIDFSRYRNIAEKDFDKLFPEGLTDFGESFFKKNFGLGREEIQSVIQASYEKTEAGTVYRLKRENSLILSAMRALETSLDTLPLFTAGEIMAELRNLPQNILPNKERLYSLLVSGLDNALITHADGMTTKLFITPKGGLSGIFHPDDKPWTRELVPAEQLNYG